MADVTTYKFGEYNQFKVGNFTIDTTTATGTQAVTGVGFTPTACVFIAVEHNVVGEMSTGMDDGSSPQYLTDRFNLTADAYAGGSSYSIIDWQTGVNYYFGKINSLDSDGFTIGWTKGGSPTGTLTVVYMAVA